MISGTRAAIAALNGARSARGRRAGDRSPSRGRCSWSRRRGRGSAWRWWPRRRRASPRPTPSSPRDASSGSRRERAPAHRRAGDRRHVRDRRERHVDARAPQRPGGGARVAAGDLAAPARRPAAPSGRCGSRRPPGRCRRSASRPRARRSWRVSARSWSGEVMLSRNRIAPAVQPFAQRVAHVRAAPSCPGSAARRACRPAARALSALDGRRLGRGGRRRREPQLGDRGRPGRLRRGGVVAGTGADRHAEHERGSGDAEHGRRRRRTTLAGGTGTHDDFHADTRRACTRRTAGSRPRSRSPRRRRTRGDAARSRAAAG